MLTPSLEALRSTKTAAYLVQYLNPTNKYARSRVMNLEDIKRRIEAGIPGATVTVKDMTGSGDHLQAEVISPAFSGKTRIEQHQMVYASLGELMSGPIHALKLLTKEK